MDPRSLVLSNPILVQQIIEWIFKDYRWWPVSQPSKKPSRGDNTDLSDDLDDSDDSDDSHPSFGRGGILARCAQVNKLWFYEAARVLWRDWDDWPVFGQSVLFKTFEKMNPTRRQIYANMVQSAELVAIEDEDLLEKVQTTFEDITFPNLKTIELLVPGDCNYETNRVQIPIFHAPRLTSLSIDPHYEWDPPLYFVSRDEWKILFEIVRVSCRHYARYLKGLY